MSAHYLIKLLLLKLWIWISRIFSSSNIFKTSCQCLRNEHWSGKKLRKKKMADEILKTFWKYFQRKENIHKIFSKIFWNKFNQKFCRWLLLQLVEDVAAECSIFLNIRAPINTRTQHILNNKYGLNTDSTYRVFFFHWYPPKKLKYGKPRLGESTST